MTSGREMERVYSFHPEPTRCPGARACLVLAFISTTHNT